MSHLKKCIVSGVVLVSLLGFASATPELNTAQPMTLSKNFMLLQKPMRNSHHYEHSFAHSWRLALHKCKQLTPKQVRVIANAAIILYGDSSYQVGKIKKVSSKNNHQNYQIGINNQSGKLLETVLMNGSNGKVIFIHKH